LVDLALLQSVSYIAGALGVCVAAVYYVYNMGATRKTQELALKAQQQNLETRQAQLFMQVFNRYDTEFWKQWLQGMSREYKDYDEWNRDRSDQNLSAARLNVTTYMMGIGTLVKRGLLSSDIVADLMGGPVIMWWQKFFDYYREYRVRANYPGYVEDLEYLYDELMKLHSAGYSPKWSLAEVGRGSQGDGD